jgi:protein translocase SecG subunit
MSQFMIGLMVVGFVIISVMMMLVVLIQRPTGGGLSGAFGAASEGAGQTAFGARTGDALTTATIVIFLLFLGFAIALNYVVEPPAAAGPAQVVPESAAGAEAPAAPVPSPASSGSSAAGEGTFQGSEQGAGQDAGGGGENAGGAE